MCGRAGLERYFSQIGVWISVALEDNAVFEPDLDGVLVKDGLAAVVTEHADRHECMCHLWEDVCLSSSWR